VRFEIQFYMFKGNMLIFPWNHSIYKNKQNFF